MLKQVKFISLLREQLIFSNYHNKVNNYFYAQHASGLNMKIRKTKNKKFQTNMLMDGKENVRKTPKKERKNLNV